MAIDVEKLRRTGTPGDLPFSIRKIGHVVLRASDPQRPVDFYTKVLGFEISDVSPEEAGVWDGQSGRPEPARRAAGTPGR